MRRTDGREHAAPDQFESMSQVVPGRETIGQRYRFPIHIDRILLQDPFQRNPYLIQHPLASDVAHIARTQMEQEIAKQLRDPVTSHEYATDRAVPRGTVRRSFRDDRRCRRL